MIGLTRFPENWDDDKAERYVLHLCRFLSWQHNRPVHPMAMDGLHKWWHMPLVFADTGEWMTVPVEERP